MVTVKVDNEHHVNIYIYIYISHIMYVCTYV